MRRLNFDALVTDVKNYSYPLVCEQAEITEEIATNLYFKQWALVISNKLEHENCEQFSLRYYELIHNYCTYHFKKMAENASKKKVAKLVSFVVTTRVVVNENEMPEVEEEEAIEKAIEKITKNPNNYIIFDNFDQCQNDSECPFGELEEDYNN